MLVLDTSAIFGLIIPDERNAYTLALAAALKTNTASVPSLFFYEVANVCAKNQKNGRWSSTICQELLGLLDALYLDVRVLSCGQIAAVNELALKYSLSSYDASYLFLAMEKGALLATQDEKLKRAALNEGAWFNG